MPPQIPFQAVMTEFIHAQLTFHARAMELYTAAYQQAQNIREDEIVEVSFPIWATEAHGVVPKLTVANTPPLPSYKQQGSQYSRLQLRLNDVTP